ncbi:histidinol-phosphatase [Paenibacillus selenitireducens]|uniref:Histidinol-phosphatase n=1 Tax=Paenibacillus selenitireducens TaxID=1324314 RepID=A0A1T2X215_9BACL|nr:PHP domain-containing protein [Paenibacillus selenitireducens]OPA73938.1 histidinol-phosphatase [Paenibacillus selenitireducens]
MKVDFHFHLEEGPYSTGWLQRTARALEHVHQEKGTLGNEPHSLEWITRLNNLMKERMDEGCFSDTWLAHYFELGQARGIERFGMVDHLYRFTEFRSYYEKHMILDDSELGRMQQYWLDRVCVTSIEPYLAAVKRAKAAGYPVSLGVEADFFPGGEAELRELLSRYELDYVIGSVHFVDGWGFDNPDTKHLFENQDLVALYAKVFGYVQMAARSGLFDMIAHLDNLKVFNFRPDEQLLLPLYEEVAKTLKEADVATEINTGLAYRYPVKEACPSPAFLQVLHQHGVPLTLSSDSHFPDDIGTQLDEAMELLSRTGYTEIIYVHEKQRITVPLRNHIASK